MMSRMSVSSLSCKFMVDALLYADQGLLVAQLGIVADGDRRLFYLPGHCAPLNIDPTVPDSHSLFCLVSLHHSIIKS